MSPATLVSLPDELIHAILLQADPESALALQETCRRFDEVTTSAVLWRTYCLRDFHYWDDRHNIPGRLEIIASATPWKDLYATRRLVDSAVTGVLNSIIKKMHARVSKYNDILAFGYDGKDTLLRHARAKDSYPDFLARRYWSLDILRFLHRGVALSSWQRLRDGEDISIEYALGAFDMLVMEDEKIDMHDTEKMIDSLAKDLTVCYPRISRYSPRQKALCIVEYLHREKLTGIAVSSQRSYYALEHNFVGLALRDSGHNSLPLISAVIYCSLAKRFDLDAHPCSFPFHVHVIVRPSPGMDFNGRAIEDGRRVRPMYLDPCCETKEVPVEKLQDQLSAIQTPGFNLSMTLRKASLREIVLRCGKNIMNSISELGSNSSIHRTSPVDSLTAKYAAFWSYIFFFDIVSNQHHPGVFAGNPGHLMLRSILPPMLHSILAHFPSDIHFLQKHILPLVEGTGALAESLHSLFENAQASDRLVRSQKRRNTRDSSAVSYKVGQVFTHRRYDYWAVITGWKMQYKAGEQARRHSANPTIYYHAVAEDRSKRYVSQDSIKPIYPTFVNLPISFLEFAGRYFKTWDPNTCLFVSNLQDEYPDD